MVDDRHGGFGLDSAANTPGELPRHIRARSMGLDDTDELVMDDQDPTIRARMSHSSPGGRKGSSKRGFVMAHSNLKDASAPSPWNSRKGKAGGGGVGSMQWLNSRAPEEDSSSSEEES